MNHWRFLGWLVPGLAERHEREARRRGLELEAIKRKQQRVVDAVSENTTRLEDIKAQIEVLGRGVTAQHQQMDQDQQAREQARAREQAPEPKGRPRW